MTEDIDPEMRPDRQNRAPTADDVALLAGTSRSAVSRSFTEGASVAPATREKVMAAAKKLGYRVNFLARGLSQQRTNLISLVVSDLDNPFRAAMMDQLARQLIDIHYRPFVLPTGAGNDTRHLMDMMLHYNVCGAIVTGDASPAEIAEECAAYGIPLALINKPDIGAHAANVSMNTEKAGMLAANALKDAGCRSVTIASQRRQSHSIGQRIASFMQHAEHIGLDVAGEFQGALQNYDGGIEAGEAFLASGLKVDGAYCVNDYLALGFVDLITHKGGMRIPRDIKIVACDDIAEASWLSYDLTTIRQDPADIARLAVERLMERINKAEVTTSSGLVDVKLIQRGSTRSDGQTD